MSKPLLDGRSPAQRIQEAIDLLKDNGYVVRGPMVMRGHVKTPTHLVNYFYDTLARYRPSSVTIYAGNMTRDRALAKSLIASRQKTGCSKKRAVVESCELIDLLFKYEEHVGLSGTVSSMAVLGQDRMGWVTEKLLQIREDLDRSLMREEDARFFQRMYKSQEENVEQLQLEAARKHMDEVLSKYGKKEKS